MSATGLVRLLTKTLASRYPVMRKATDPPDSPQDQEERMRIEDQIHSLADHVKVSIVEECTTHYALWFYSAMFGLDNLTDLAEELTGQLWYEAHYPEIPKRVIISCDANKFTCIAIAPGLVVAGGRTTVGVLSSSSPVSGERGHKQGVFRRFDVTRDESHTRATIVAICVVNSPLVSADDSRDGPVISLFWDDAHGSSYTFVTATSKLRFIRKFQKRDYISMPLRCMAPVFNDHGRITYRSHSAVVTYPVYRALGHLGGIRLEALSHDGMKNYMQVDVTHCGESPNSYFFTCDSGFAAWYDHTRRVVVIDYCPVTMTGSTVYQQHQGGAGGVRESMTTRFSLAQASAHASSLHITRPGVIFIGFDNGGIVAFGTPVVTGDHDQEGWDNRLAWVMLRGHGGLTEEDCVCNADTGFGGAIEGIYSNPTGDRLAIILSSGFMQVYDLVEGTDEEGKRAVNLIPVRTIDLLVLTNVLDERLCAKEAIPLDVSRPEKRAKLSLAAIEGSGGREVTDKPRHGRFAGSKKIVCMDARRIVYYNVDMQIFSVWSFGPCI